jgi:hypothetical protein
MIGEDGRAEHQDQVMAGEAGDDLPAVRGEKAGKQRVVLGKAVAARIGCRPDRRPMSFGEGDDLVLGVVARTPGADDKGRTRAGTQRLGYLAEQLRVAAHDGGESARLDRVAEAVPVVDRD